MNSIIATLILTCLAIQEAKADEYLVNGMVVTSKDSAVVVTDINRSVCEDEWPFECDQISHFLKTCSKIGNFTVVSIEARFIKVCFDGVMITTYSGDTFTEKDFEWKKKSDSCSCGRNGNSLR